MYEIYTDGSSLGNPGPSGWGVAAILRALEECVKRDIQEVRIFTDSNYVKQGINTWIIKWKQNGWMTSAGAPVKNKDLWIAVDEMRNKLKVVEWRWVKAHNGDPKNEEADTLARESAKNKKSCL